MITGEIKSQVDKVWDTFWTGGISNPMEVAAAGVNVHGFGRFENAGGRGPLFDSVSHCSIWSFMR